MAFTNVTKLEVYGKDREDSSFVKRHEQERPLKYWWISNPVGPGLANRIPCPVDFDEPSEDQLI